MATYTPNFNSNNGSFCGEASLFQHNDHARSITSEANGHMMRSIGMNNSDRDTQASSPSVTNNKNSNQRDIRAAQSDLTRDTTADEDSTQRYGILEQSLFMNWELFADQIQHMTKDRSHYHGVLRCAQHLDASLELLHTILARKSSLERSLHACDAHWDGAAAAAVLMQDVDAVERQTVFLWRSMCATVLTLRAHEHGLVECAQSHMDLSRRATREVIALRKKQVRAEAKEKAAAAAAAAAAVVAAAVVAGISIGTAKESNDKKKKKNKSSEEASHQRTDIIIQIKQHDGDMHLVVAKDEQRMAEVVRAMLVRLPASGNGGGTSSATSQTQGIH